MSKGEGRVFVVLKVQRIDESGGGLGFDLVCSGGIQVGNIYQSLYRKVWKVRFRV